MRRPALGLAWISVTAAVAGYFLPWATVTVADSGLAALAGEAGGGEVRLEIRREDGAIQASLSDLRRLPRTIRGWEIPSLVRGQDMAVVAALLDLWTGPRRHVVAKGAAAPLVPVAALIVGVVLVFARAGVLGTAAVSLLCAAVASVGAWKAAAAGRMGPLTIRVEEGLALSLLAYAGLAIAAGWLSALNMQQRRQA
jgi:hypothetical protein